MAKYRGAAAYAAQCDQTQSSRCTAAVHGSTSGDDSLPRVPAEELANRLGTYGIRVQNHHLSPERPRPTLECRQRRGPRIPARQRPLAATLDNPRSVKELGMP